MQEISNTLPDRSIGKKLKKVRESKALTLSQISSGTKIRTEYLSAIENDMFDKFDSHVYAKGFIKNYALFLAIDYEPLLALYRRDYENVEKKRKLISNKEEINEKKKISENIKIESTITKRKIAYSIAFVLVTFISVGLFIFLQNIFKPPMLRITSPDIEKDEKYKLIETEDKSIRIAGSTDPNTLIKVNDEPIALNPGYTFETDFLPLTSERNIINIEAISQLGVKSSVQLEFLRDDLKNQVIDVADAILMIKEKPVFLLVRADGVIKFNDIAVPNEAINITADQYIEIETSEPQFVVIQINEVPYQLEKTFERFELGNQVRRIN